MIEVPSMPFYWRFKETPGTAPGDPPERVPFTFDYDPRLDLFIERRSEKLTALLSDIYSRSANVGFMQDGHSLINSYGADFWRFLTDLLAEYPAKNILEVGCGGCVLLERLKDLGKQVIGVDPSPFASEAGRRKGIEVIQEFFPPRSLHFRPDLIFQVDVLEHIEDPLSFLLAQAECLNEDGLIVVNVPDCSRSIDRGDISMALHQHVNMFDYISLPATFRAAGLEVVKLERSRYGAALYCAARKARVERRAPAADGRRWDLFRSKAHRSAHSFQNHVERATQRDEKIGFFMPQRAFPYLGLIDWFEDFRIFDNANMWHNRYLDGIDARVENQADLVARPVDHVFVMSLSFGKEVADTLRRDVPGMKITTLDEILSDAQN
jgi:SAM-dependent methyltransferase